MDMLLQLAMVTTSVCVVAMVLRRTGKKDREQIEAGAVSPGWLAEFKVRRRDWPPGER